MCLAIRGQALDCGQRPLHFSHSAYTDAPSWCHTMAPLPWHPHHSTPTTAPPPWHPNHSTPPWHPHQGISTVTLAPCTPNSDITGTPPWHPTAVLTPGTPCSTPTVVPLECHPHQSPPNTVSPETPPPPDPFSTT